MNAAFLRRLLPALLGASVASAADPILHYPFDGDLDDASPSGNPATSAGAATVSSDPGKPVIGSGAAVFTGAAGSWLSLAAPVAFTNRQTWSAAFWAKRTGTANDKGMVLGDTNNTQNFIYFTDGSKCLRFRASNNTADFPYVVDRQIHHYALTVAPKAADGNTVTVSLYLDGAFLAAKDCGSGAMSVNAVGQGYSNNNYIFSGTLDDVRLYDGLLAPAEIAALYAMRGGPLARWNFEGDFADSTGNGRDGTATGAGLSFTVDADALRVGTNALALNGSAHLTLANPLAFADGEQWSAAFWARRAGTANQGMVMGDTAGSSDFIWVTGNFNGFRFRSASGSTTVDFTSVKDNALHHYVLTANGDGKMCLFVDGVFAQTLSAADTGFLVASVGQAHNENQYRFKGNLDDVRVYGYALNSSDAARLFREGKQELLRLTFDESTVRDSSAFTNGVTLAGAAATTVDPADVAAAPAALVLDGAKNSYVVLSADIVFTNGEPWTAAFWARRDGGVNQGMVMGAPGNNNDFIWVTGNFNGFRFRPSAGGSLDFTCAKDPLMHHYALTANGDGTMTLYVDGSLKQTLAFGDTSFKVNRIGYAYENDGYTFKGVLDDVRVYNYAVGASSVSNLFASGGSQRFHFDFEGGLQDRSPCAVTATANGSAAVSVDASAPVGNGSLVLDGADASYLALSPALALANSNAWSAVFWARKTGNSNQGMVMGDRSNITDFLWLTGDPANKGFRFRPHSGGGNSRDFTTPRDGALRHYALVSLGDGTLHLYLDGGFSEALSTPDTSVTINSIGCAYSSSGFNYKGALDDVRVFSYALAPTNIAFLYGLRQAEPPPLVTRVRVFLQGGQSNSEGRADPAQLPAGLQLPQDDVDFYYYADNALTKLRPATNGGTQFGPEITFGRRLSDRLCRDASNRVAVVKYSVGGSNLHTQWKAGGDATTAGDGPYYVNWQNTVAAGLAALAANYPYAEITVEGMIWMQGESDADTAEHGAAYDANLTALIADIRLTLGLPRLPFVIGRIGQSSLHGRSGYAAVRVAQAVVAARNSWTGWIDTDGFSLKSDNLHFDGPGQMAMGYAFADAVLALPDRGTFFSVR
jgi:hypothetical protein